MRILIADTQPRVRHALSVLLSAHPHWEVVAACADAAGLREALRRCQPEVLLLDLELPGLAEEHCVLALRAACPGARFVAMSADPEQRQEALAAGMDAFICKLEPIEALLDAAQRG